MEIAIANVHLDLGAGRRGTDMGPSAMHVAGLVPRLERIGHRVRSVEAFALPSTESMDVGATRAKYLEPIRRTCAGLADHVAGVRADGAFPLVLGGDHSVAIGTISGLVRSMRPAGGRLGVLWVDAHTDMNTPDTSPSGNIHGMPLATLLGHGVPDLMAIGGAEPPLRPEDVVVIGARDVDAGEAEFVRELGVRVISMSEIDTRGLARCVDEALEQITANTSGIHLSFDLDGVDPRDAPGVGTPVPGGLGLRESHLLCEKVARTGQLIGMEMVELNPILDHANKTGELAVWLIESALGKTIL